jgi:hypothetical protein
MSANCSVSARLAVTRLASTIRLCIYDNVVLDIANGLRPSASSELETAPVLLLANG